MSMTTIHSSDLTVHGWIRENYLNDLLDDIINIIYRYFLIRIDSKILNENEQVSLMNLLFEKLKKQSENKDMKYLGTELLFRGSEHGFECAKFHELCSNKGATVTITYNEYDHVFGGYVTKSWDTKNKNVDDPTAFLWMVRPKVKAFDFENIEEDCVGLYVSKHYGPMFGSGLLIVHNDRVTHSGS